MNGFRKLYEQTLRVEESSLDWRAYAIDYGSFKSRLLVFKQCRYRLKTHLRASVDGMCSKSLLRDVLGTRNQDNLSSYVIPLIESSSTVSRASAAGAVPSQIMIGGGDSSRSLYNSGAEKRYNKQQVLRRISNAERNQVTIFLTTEMDKVAQFYHKKCQQLSQQLLKKGPSEEFGQEILELMAHLTLNAIALRQSLIRYDAFVRTYGGTPMLVWFMKKMDSHHHSFKTILEHPELNELYESFSKESVTTYYGSLIETQWQLFVQVDDESKKRESLASQGQTVLLDSFVSTLRHYLLLGAIGPSLSLEPSFLTQRGASLHREMRKLAAWRRQTATATLDDPASKKATLTWKQTFALALNILSAFFYCMNYYIVEPSSTKYVNALGAPDYISGTLIGMMPLASMLSAVGYAIWTNDGFRVPFIFSALLMFGGNLVYASALKYETVWVALAGRFLTGLGGPKCIVRRYMADTTPVAMRTTVNAFFALAIAVGSALGPAVAIALDELDFVFNVPLYGEVEVNGMTGPGYFMATIWFIFTSVVMWTFDEPDRKGLEEQMRLEKAMHSPAATRDSSPVRCGGSRDVSLERQAIANDDSMHENKSENGDDLKSIYSGAGDGTDQTVRSYGSSGSGAGEGKQKSQWRRICDFFDLITPPVRLCLALLLAKTFSIEALVSCTSALTKNRYNWRIAQVGVLGCINGLLVVPLSIVVGYMSMRYQDRVLMTWLVVVGCIGMFLLIDVTDLIDTSTDSYNEGKPLAVTPTRYVTGYFLTYVSIQSFEGVIGSALSKVIPTALASGTFNSGLLATMVDTLGRACGDIFISLMGFINLRQLMNLLFIPVFLILLGCLVTIRRYYDLLAV